MTLQEIVTRLGLSVLNGNGLQQEVSCAHVSDILGDFRAASTSALWITHLAHEQAAALACMKKAAAVLLPAGIVPEPEMLEQAQRGNLTLLASPDSAFVLAGRLYELGLKGRP